MLTHERIISMNILKTLLTTTMLTMAGLTVAGAASLDVVAASTYRLHAGPSKSWGSVADRFVCSAVAISPTRLVTAAHCIPDDKKLGIMIEERDGYDIVSRMFYTVKTIKTNHNNDTALLELKTKHQKFETWVDIAPTFLPSMGDSLHAVGYPRGHELTLTEGMFTTRTKLPESMGVLGDFYKTTVPVTGGSSGGGLYTRDWDPIKMDWDYQLVGLTTAGWNDVSFQTYFSTVEAVNEIIKGFVNG